MIFISNKRNQTMRHNGKWLITLFIIICGIIPIKASDDAKSDSVTLYTPLTKITVAPGESLTYSIDIINNSDGVKTLAVSVSGLPSTWKTSLKSANWNVQQIAVLPKEKQTIILTVEIPLKVNKGTYRFGVTAGENTYMTLAVNVREQGTFETSLTAQQANMEGHSKSNFNFNTTLNNRTAEKQLYALRAVAPRGWIVTFKPNYVQATSVELEANTTKEIQVEVHPPETVAAGTYVIPVSAVTSATSASLNLEVVITGTFSLELTTPTGMVSTGITSGDQKKIELLLKNTGSSVLVDVNLSSSAPVNWEVTFDPKKIERIESGENATVTATIKAAKRALAGDYIANIEARAAEVSSKLVFRLSVRTPMLLGWIGILIIIAAGGSVYYLFRKYGRR
jgi:uncharacterized membrane protein